MGQSPFLRYLKFTNPTFHYFHYINLSFALIEILFVKDIMASILIPSPVVVDNCIGVKFTNVLCSSHSLPLIRSVC